jgi:hypothetical protein
MKEADKIADGLKLLAKYDATGYGTCMEHDQIWAGPDASEDVSVEDADALLALGWFEDGDVARWSFSL